MLLGCIADDFTGATDLALMLSRNGLETVQTIGTPGPGRNARCRGGRGRAQEPHHPARRSGRPVARRAAPAAGRRRQADLLQILLDLQFDAGRQYRPGRRRAARCARRRLHHRLPRLPGQRAHDLSRPPVRRRRAAVGFGHAQPPADADDRRQPRARARQADAATRSAWCRTPTVDAGAERGARGVRRAAQGRASATPSSMRSATSISAPSAPPAPGWRWSPAARVWRWACPPTSSATSRAAKTGTLPRIDGRRRSHRRKLLGGDARPDRGDEGAPPRPRHRPAGARPRSGRRGDRVGEAEAGAGAGPDLRQRRAGQGGADPREARSRRIRRADRAHPRRLSPRGSSTPACGVSSSPAARRRAPSSPSSA